MLVHRANEKFQSLKREAACLARLESAQARIEAHVSIPQAGSGLFSLEEPVIRRKRVAGFNPSSGKRPV